LIVLSLPDLDVVLGRIGAAGHEVAGVAADGLRGLAESLRESAAAYLDASTSADASGALASSLIVESAADDGAPLARVASELSYAAAQEHGFEGIVTVSEHLRRVREAFGRPIRTERLARVRPHARRMVVPAKRFLARAVDDLHHANPGVQR
jgi:hypothetical protein